MDNSLSLAFKRCVYESGTAMIFFVFFPFICLFVHFFLILCINGDFNMNLPNVCNKG